METGKHPSLWAVALLSIACAQPASADVFPKPTPEQLAFFEKKIRPVLIEHCYQCHAADAKNIRGSLLVDSQQGLRQGGDSGPALVPGKPDESLIIEALRHESYEMPPSEKLPDRVINDFVTWIEMGAPDPRTATAPRLVKSEIDLAAGRDYWAFRPLQQHPVPDVQHSDWPRSPIDRFILARQEAAGLTPGPDADRLTLLRRLFIDLIGLPPTPEQILEFQNATSADAIAQLVDRLLDSPQFGERWGRHWLDLARYANSTGGGRSLLYGEAWRYRDYVIESFNEDKPFDRFVIEQIAGDLLPYSDYQQGREQLTATAFLALGPTNYENQDKQQLRMDVIDEQIDTVGKTFLGMTIGCARCHDHKFDPIPTADYYALAGIFRSTHSLVDANVSKWVTTPLPMSPRQRAQLAEVERRKAPLKDQIAAAERKIREWKDRSEGIVVDDDDAELQGQWTESTYHKTFVGRGYRHASSPQAWARFQVMLAPGRYQVQFADNGYASRSSHVEVRITHAEGTSTQFINQQVPPPISGLYRNLGDFEFAGQATVTVQPRDSDYTIIDAVRFVPVDDEAGVKGLNAALAGLADTEKQLKSLKQQLARLEKSAPQVAEVMSVADQEKKGDYHICIRGNYKNLGDVVPRGFLSVITEKPPAIPASTSGRLHLARWIASRENPLTARVFVNRVWAQLFGRGIVATVDNFGSPGERPTHPELLDYLADNFIESGWSVKHLIRTIVLSRTYQLASESSQRAEIDPENRLLAHQNRKRLDAECLHDSLLLVSGELTGRIGGPSVRAGTKSEYGYEFEYHDRAVYLPVFRNELPELFAVFDFPDPNLSRGHRTSSVLSTQALFMMNSPFVIDRADRAANRVLAMPVSDDERLEWLSLSLFGRMPAPAERGIVDRYLHSNAGQGTDQEWRRVTQALMGSVDLRYVD